MLKIALCDDDIIFMGQMVLCIHETLKSINESAKIITYSSSIDLIDSVSEGERFDIYFLDIEMPKCDGLCTAERLRVYEPNSIIMFLTSHLEYAAEGYKVDAFRYIFKSTFEDNLPDILCKALERIQRINDSALVVQYYTNYTRVLYREIMYIQKIHRSVHISTTKQGKIKDNRGIKELASIIEDPSFVITDRSYIVNLNYVRSLDGIWLVMIDGNRIPISRPMMSKVKSAMIHLWGEGK